MHDSGAGTYFFNNKKEWKNSGVTGGKKSCNDFKKRRNGQTLKRTWRLESGVIVILQSLTLKIGSVAITLWIDQYQRLCYNLKAKKKWMKMCSNSHQGSHELNAIWSQDTTYLEREPCINVLSWSAFIGRTMMRNICFKNIRFYFVSLDLCNLSLLLAN